MKAAVASFFVLALSVSALNEGPVSVKIDGQEKQWYVLELGYPKEHMQVDQDRIRLSSNSGLNFAKYASDSFDPNMWEEINPVGKRIGYTVDLSQVGCSCNSCLTMVAMPGYDQNGNPAPAGGNYYCDANKIGGNYCPEFDISEANMYALATTAHKCNDPNNNHYDWCDGAGLQTRVYEVDQNAYCPQDHCTINTMKPYRHECDFKTGDDGVLNQVTCTLYQDDRNFSYDLPQDADYLSQVDGQLKRGVVLDMCLWGGSNADLQWLDGDTGCQGDCNVGASSQVFSDLEITSLSSIAEIE